MFEIKTAAALFGVSLAIGCYVNYLRRKAKRLKRDNEMLNETIRQAKKQQQKDAYFMKEATKLALAKDDDIAKQNREILEKIRKGE